MIKPKNWMFNLDKGEKILWHAKIDEAVFAKEIRIYKIENTLILIMLLLAASAVTLGLMGRLKSGEDEYAIWRLIIFLVIMAIFIWGLLKYGRDVGSEKDGYSHVKAFAITNKRFIAVSAMGELLDHVDINEIRRVRRFRLFWRTHGANSRLGLGLYKDFDYFAPIAQIWGLPDYKKAKKEIQTALKELHASHTHKC